MVEKIEGSFVWWLHFPFPTAALLFLLRLVVALESLPYSFRAGSFYHSELACKIYPPGHPGMTPTPLFHPLSFCKWRTQWRIMSLIPVHPQASTHNCSWDSPKILFSIILSLKLPAQHFLDTVLVLRVKATSVSTSGIVLPRGKHNVLCTFFLDAEAPSSLWAQSVVQTVFLMEEKCLGSIFLYNVREDIGFFYQTYVKEVWRLMS